VFERRRDRNGAFHTTRRATAHRSFTAAGQSGECNRSSANAKLYADSGVTRLAALRDPSQSLQRLADEATPMICPGKAPTGF
jgi:hypothetical protein